MVGVLLTWEVVLHNLPCGCVWICNRSLGYEYDLFNEVKIQMLTCSSPCRKWHLSIRLLRSVSAVHSSNVWESTWNSLGKQCVCFCECSHASNTMGIFQVRQATTCSKRVRYLEKLSESIKKGYRKRSGAVPHPRKTNVAPKSSPHSEISVSYSFVRRCQWHVSCNGGQIQQTWRALALITVYRLSEQLCRVGIWETSGNRQPQPTGRQDSRLQVMWQKFLRRKSPRTMPQNGNCSENVSCASQRHMHQNISIS